MGPGVLRNIWAVGHPHSRDGRGGTFRGGAFFMNDHFTPNDLRCDGEKYNTGGYFISITPWSWIELSYACTLLKYHKNKDVNEPVGYFNEDRRFDLKLRPLKEGKWWPALAIGVDAAEKLAEKLIKNHGSNHYYNIYMVGSKHFEIKENELAAHLGYRYFISDMNSNRRGVVGGLSFRPKFYRDLRVMAEWDGECVNVGADVLLWRHLFIQAGLTNGKYFMGGLAYHYTIKF